MMLALINVPYLHDRISKKKTRSSVGFDFISFVGNNKKALAAGRTLRDIWIFCCDGGRSKSEKKILTNIPFLVAVRYAEIAIDQKWPYTYIKEDSSKYLMLWSHWSYMKTLHQPDQITANNWRMIKSNWKITEVSISYKTITNLTNLMVQNLESFDNHRIIYRVQSY